MYCEEEPEPLCRYKYVYIPEMQDKVRDVLRVICDV
jgi:hypothetical protein